MQKQKQHNKTTQARRMSLSGVLFMAMLIIVPSTILAAETIPMYDKGANTFYINGNIQGLGVTEFMVDTGSGYMTINQNTLDILQEKGEATYVKELTGILANGERKIYPVYRLASIRLGENCVLHDVEAAVFPGNTRHILGLNALKKAGDFTFSFNPPQLRLSDCSKTST